MCYTLSSNNQEREKLVLAKHNDKPKRMCRHCNDNFTSNRSNGHTMDIKFKNSGSNARVKQIAEDRAAKESDFSSQNLRFRRLDAHIIDRWINMKKNCTNGWLRPSKKKLNQTQSTLKKQKIFWFPWDALRVWMLMLFNTRDTKKVDCLFSCHSPSFVF